jgi:3-keto-disaccharide hydrolase
MTTQLARGFLLAWTLVTVTAAQSNPPEPKLPGEDWVSLFNGKDLSGWVKIGNEQWTVENGIIHGVAVTKDYGYLMTEKPYRDFHLSIKFLCEGDGNSGVFFHTAFKPGTADVSQGLQFEVDCTIMQHTAGIYGDGRNWIVWPAPENETVVRKGEWNEYQLKVEGNRYVARLNGVPMIDFTDPSPKSFDGGIALQLHSGGQGNMKFKDIWIRDLSVRPGRQ